jgi:tight adherence protein B
MVALSVAFGLLIMGAVLLGFVGLWRLTNVEDPVEARLRQIGGAGAIALEGGEGERKRLGGLNRALGRLGFGQVLADRLSRADLSLTVAEFALIALLLAAALATVGWWRGQMLLAVLLGMTGLFLPLLYLNQRAGKRSEMFTNQLPDVLTLLVGALRAGQGVAQGIGLLVDRMPRPASVEFGRVMRAISLGVPVNRALNDMADRVGSDDLYLVVTAMNVQAELGGNLAQILETITETIRERIRIKREIRVLTAQQRFTGYLLSGLPIIVGVLLTVIRPDYLDPLFEPGIGRLMLAVMAVMMVLGFFIIRKIVDIEV